MLHNRWRFIFTIFLILIARGLGAAAQQPSPGKQGAPTIIGVVTDTAGNPLENVEVLIGSLRQIVRSGVDGSFRFEEVKPGKYDVAARRLGYFPQIRPVTVTDSGGRVAFSLVPGTPTLQPVISAVSRGGLSGVVGDSAYQILPGAEIAVVSGDHRTVTDSTGNFFLGLHPGRYMLRVSRHGFASRLVSVTIPNDSGRRIVVWLTPASRGETAHQVAALDELKLRLDTAHVVLSKLFTREDILRLNLTDAVQLAAVAAGHPLPETCGVFVDGGPESVPLWSIDPAEIEAMETYVRPGPLGGIASTRNTGGLRRASGSSCDTIVYVWLRR